jgi:hypothetical protein
VPQDDLDTHEDARERKAAESARADAATDRRLGTLRDVLTNEAARRYLWWLVEQSHVFETTYSSDASWAAFREGERNLGLRIMSDLQALGPECLTVLMKEASDGRAL